MLRTQDSIKPTENTLSSLNQKQDIVKKPDDQKLNLLQKPRQVKFQTV